MSDTVVAAIRIRINDAPDHPQPPCHYCAENAQHFARIGTLGFWVCQNDLTAMLDTTPIDEVQQ